MGEEHQSNIIRAWLVPHPSDEDERTKKDTISRLNTYMDWLEQQRRPWYEPDLVAYRDYLMSRGLAAISVNAHLYTIRARYRELLLEGTLRQVLLSQKPVDVSETGYDAKVDQTLSYLARAIEDSAALLDTPRPKVTHRRLRAHHIKALLNSPGRESETGLRDTAIFALIFTTGLRNNEVCALQVHHLRASIDGSPALHVPEGKGCVERLIPLEDLYWGVRCVEGWLTAASITEGPVFRGFYKPGWDSFTGRRRQLVRPSGLSPRSLDIIFETYPITLGDQTVVVRPMDLRRAYARLLFEAGRELTVIKERLGLSDNNALMDYIGGAEADLRLEGENAWDLLGERTWLEAR